MAKILKPLQSEGGFSVSEESIIDPDRNILKANSVEVVNNTFSDAVKKEFISFGKATNLTSTVNLENFSTLSANQIVFSKANILLSWKGYSIAQYNVNANSSVARILLDNHGLSQGDSVTLFFDASGQANNGTYTVTNVVSNSIIDVETNIIFNPSQSIVNGSVELRNYGLYWEYSLEIITTCLSDSSNNLTLAGVSKTVLKDNVPVGHVWSVYPIVNNTQKTFGYQVDISTNGSLEDYSTGVECVGFVSNVFSDRE
jgi:hypothetical protein